MTSDSLKAEADAYIKATLARASDPAFAEKLLLGQSDRDFILLLMTGFTATVVAREIGELIA